jgi:photosystem II stability/assembly factor-like uncharacterized protein
MNKLSVFIAGFLLMIFSSGIYSQMHYNYNTGGSSNTFPFGTLPATGKTIQHLYLPGDFNNPTPVAAGNITKIYFRANNTASATYTNIKIRMGLTTDTDLPSGAWYSGAMTVVYDEANVSLSSTAATFFSITLETPFYYDPTKSLVVEIEQCGYSGTGISILTTSTSGMKRHASNQTTPPPTACPHAWFNTGAFLTHTGIDVVPAVVNCTYAWTPNVSGVTGTLYSVKTVNDQVAWVCGAAATVRKTTDGGVTWTNANPNPGVINGDVYNIEALDANTAWCTTSPSATFIYKTTNGGTNWVQVYTLAAAFINAIKMTSPTVGFASGDPVGGNWLLLTTTNGGDNWTVLSAPPGTGDGRNNCLQVSLPNMWFGTGQGTVWRSTNSGINWTSSPTTPLTTQVLGMRFNNASTGFVGGASMVKTTDGGATWTAVTVPGTGNISGIDGTGSDYWYVRGTGIYRSTDGGTNWTQVHTAVGTLNDIKIAPGANGCLAGWTCATGGNIAKMTGVPVGIGNNNNEIPNNFSLSQNYPNPFNPVTSINFAIPVAGFTELRVYDALGREVAVLFSSDAPAGNHTVNFDASNLSSGIYFYTLKSGDFINTKKMALIK